MFMYLLSFQIMTVKLPLTLALTSPYFCLRFFLESCGLPFQFSDKPQLFMVLVCKLSDRK